MRNLAIGDIHGCSTALDALARYVPIMADDRVITLGDYVDRGPNSRAVLAWLIDRREQRRLVALRGNHELMMLKARDSETDLAFWLNCGGRATLASYVSHGEVGRLTDVPAEHWRFIEETQPWYETDTHIFVHANADHDLPLNDQPHAALYWKKFHEMLSQPHESGKIMVCGHTPQRDGRPKSVGHAVCIDTGAYQGRWLTCLDIASGRYWQANEHAETRRGWLEAD